MGLALRDTHFHTYADYLSWPDDVRYELIDGIAFAMAPAPLRVHQEILLELAAQTRNALDGKPCRPFIAPFDVRLPRDDEADSAIDTVVQPDLVVVCDRSKLDERGCRGAPDWVIEILSPSTAGHDLIIKRRLYERVGVREYWLVHPTDRTLTVHWLVDGRYGIPEISELKGSTALAILPEVAIAWDALVARLPPVEP